jgi:hypothetical protein
MRNPSTNQQERTTQLQQQVDRLTKASGQRVRIDNRRMRYVIELLEDAIGSTGGWSVLAKVWTYDETVVHSEAMRIWWKLGYLAGAKAGYKGEGTYEGDKLWFLQGPCVTPCPSIGSIPVQTTTPGTVGTAFSYSVTSSSITAGSFTASGLPPGLSCSASGVISGTPTTAGTYFMIISGTAPHTNGTSTCTIKRAIALTINPAP